MLDLSRISAQDISILNLGQLLSFYLCDLGHELLHYAPEARQMVAETRGVTQEQYRAMENCRHGPGEDI